MADDVAALIDALDLGRVRIIGHSMGGVNGWWFAARHPEKIERFVILDVTPSVITSQRAVDLWRDMLDAYCRARYTDPEEAVTNYLSGYTGSGRNELRTFVLNNVRESPAGLTHEKHKS